MRRRLLRLCIEIAEADAHVPFSLATGAGTTNRDWLPRQFGDCAWIYCIGITPVRPDGTGSYDDEAFQSIDLVAVKHDLTALMTDSQDWWPADFGRRAALHPDRPEVSNAVMTMPTIHGLHHFAWRCRDTEETRRFYEDLLGLPLVHVIRADTVPSTGEHCPYVHIFFRLHDGSHIAFFDLGDDEAAEPSPNTPAWVNHIALRVGSAVDLLAAKTRLEAAGVEVLGVTDHHIIESIYFFDPNGLRLELTTPSVPAAEMDRLAGVAHAELATWGLEKQARRSTAGAGR